MKQNDPSYPEQVLESTLQAVRKRTQHRESIRRGLVILVLLGVLTGFLVDLISGGKPMEVSRSSEEAGTVKLSIIHKIEPLSPTEKSASSFIQVFSSQDSTLQVHRIGDPELHELLAGETYGLYQTKDGRQHLWKSD